MQSLFGNRRFSGSFGNWISLIKNNSPIPNVIQVAARLTDPKIKKREINGLLTAMEHFGLQEGLILTGDESGHETIADKTILYRPIWQWLLDGSK